MEHTARNTKPACQSQFSARVAVPLFFGMIATICIPLAIFHILTSSRLDVVVGIIVLLGLLVLWLTMVWGELRKKAISIRFHKAGIDVSTFLGWGKKVTYRYTSITGFEIGLEPALPSPYEVIVLVQNRTDLLRISSFYFSNYKELKEVVADKCTYHGERPFHTKDAFRDIFR